jgi:hypothetical protein
MRSHYCTNQITHDDEEGIRCLSVSQSASRSNFPEEEEEDFAAPKQALSSFDNFLSS